MTTGPGETVVQSAGETRFVVDCKVNPTASVGHVKIILAPEGITVSCGGGSVILNTVPEPELPPCAAVPYRVLPHKINPAIGKAPSLLVWEGPENGVKLWRVVNPVPSVFTLKTVPKRPEPESLVVPYSVLPDKTKPAMGKSPSLLV